MLNNIGENNEIFDKPIALIIIPVSTKLAFIGCGF
mgnify:CR=1 FL=1